MPPASRVHRAGRALHQRPWRPIRHARVRGCGRVCTWPRPCCSDRPSPSSGAASARRPWRAWAARSRLVGLALFLPDGTGRRQATPSRGRLIASDSRRDCRRLPLVDLSLTLPAARPRVQPFVLLAAASAVLAVALVLRAAAAGRAGVLPGPARDLLADGGVLPRHQQPTRGSTSTVVQRVGCDAAAPRGRSVRHHVPQPVRPGHPVLPAGAGRRRPRAVRVPRTRRCRC